MRNALIAAVLACSLLSQSCVTGDVVTIALGHFADELIAADLQSHPEDAPLMAEFTLCANAAVAEVGSSDSPLVRSTRIGTACAVAIAEGRKGPAYLVPVIAALGAFLNAVEVVQSAIIQYPAQANSFAAHSKSAKVDKGKLAKIQKKLEPLKKKYGK